MKAVYTTTRRDGFTLVELLVVIAIVAILSATLRPELAPSTEQEPPMRILSAKSANEVSTHVIVGAICGYTDLGVKTYKQSLFTQDAHVMWGPEDGPEYVGSVVYDDGSSAPDSTVDRGPRKRNGKAGGVVFDITGGVSYVKYEAWKNEAKNLQSTDSTAPQAVQRVAEF